MFCNVCLYNVFLSFYSVFFLSFEAVKTIIVKAVSKMGSFLLFGHNINRTLMKNKLNPFIA